MPSSTKYKGSALVIEWLTAAGGTIDLTGDSRVVTVQEQSQRIDVTTRGDSAKAFLNETAEITISVTGLDGSGTANTNWNWDRINSGDSGTVRWSPEGTATGYRKRTLAARLNTKGFTSPYDNAAEWTLEFASNGGTVVQASW